MGRTPKAMHDALSDPFGLQELQATVDRPGDAHIK